MAITAALPATAAAQDVRAGVEAWQRRDYATAVRQWQGPAAAGNADAEFNMGQAYKLGHGVPPDPAQALEWYRRAAAQGHTQAETSYALALYTGGRKAEAAPWLEKAAARGEPRGELMLGRMLFEGDGVPRDMPRAYALTSLAAGSGLKPATETLAQMDRYVSPAERAAGTRLAEHYAAGQRAVAHGRVRVTQDVPPAKPLPRATPTASATVSPPPRPTARPTVSPPPPTPRPTPAPRPTQAAGTWRAQLGAFRDRSNAEALWARVRNHMAGARPAYSQSSNLTKLQATGFASQRQAQEACAAAGVACIVLGK